MRKQVLGLLGAVSIGSAALVAGGPAANAVTAAPAANAAPMTSTATGGTVSPQSSIGGKVSRKEAISRAKYWYTHRSSIPYNGGASYRDPDGHHKYRQDCSGYVSMALHISPSGIGAPSTVNLPSFGTKLKSRRSMQMGDYTGILGNGTGGSAGHVRLFEKWSSKSKGTYWAYDFGSTPVKHAVYQLSTDQSRNGIGWTAYRYKKIS
jgi:hypothetical protein